MDKHSLLDWSTFALACATGILAIATIGLFLAGWKAYSVARRALSEERAAFNKQATLATEAMQQQSADAQNYRRLLRSQETMTFVFGWLSKNREDWQAFKTYCESQHWTVQQALGDHWNEAAIRARIRPILEGMEHMALGVRSNVYDFSVIDNLARNYIINMYEQTSDYIQKVRTGSESPKRQPQPAAYEQLSALTNDLQQQRLEALLQETRAKIAQQPLSPERAPD